MRVNGHEIPRRLVLALSGSNGDGVLRSDDAVPMKAAFLEAFGIDLNLSAGALYGWKFICGQDSASWVECPDEILKPTDLLETSERAPQTLTSVAIGDVSRDQLGRPRRRVRLHHRLTLRRPNQRLAEVKLPGFYAGVLV